MYASAWEVMFLDKKTHKEKKMIQSRIIKKQKKAKSIRNPLFIRNQTKLNSDISQVYNSTMFMGTKGM